MRGPDAVDPATATRLLRAALEKGADFADVFFEYRRSRSFVMEDGRVRTVGGGVDMGVGIRAVKGAAVGYAYAESLDMEAMLEAARTAGEIATSGRRKKVAVRSRRVKQLYRPEVELVDADGDERAALLRRADKAARKASKKIVRVDASVSAVHKEVLVVSSDGDMVFDDQPMVRLGVSALAKAKGRTEQGSAAAAGFGVEYFDRVSPGPRQGGRRVAW